MTEETRPFFFTSMDVYRESTANTQIATIPTLLMRGGDFSQTLGDPVEPTLLDGRFSPTKFKSILRTTRTLTAGQLDPTTGLVKYYRTHP